MRWNNKSIGASVLSAALLAGCGGAPLQPGDAADEVAEAEAGDEAAGPTSAALRAAASRLLQTPVPGAGWETYLFPGKRFVAFEPVEVLGQEALRVKANSSVSILRQRFEPPLDSVGRLSFSWKVDGLPKGADLSQAALADSPVRVVLAFEGDRSRWSARAHRLSELSRLLTGEELPYATLVYVWGRAEARGTVLTNPRTDRVRKIVVDSGSAGLGRWQSHVRDVRADFALAFGEEPGPLRLVALMTDTDNTRSRLTAWYGPLRLEHRAD